MKYFIGYEIETYHMSLLINLVYSMPEIVTICLVRQLNSRNGPVKVKSSYLCISGCCRLRNTPLVTSRDDGSTAGSSLETRFLPEYLAVTLSRSGGFQGCQQIFVSSGHFLILERAKKSKGLSQVNKVEDLFL
jgi:hypothetical protein